ncbi:hypothetical protein [Pedobacter nutrimenti]|uniref:Uncharacterized protein n=1 Tax=Pedobacter nutrimenti TaxID=1241337 RepID=A0A318UEM2_9SPHI|nr:hypothetical protein [Pedobacter nutrimenti]PYF72976.1 hypothetical protein B0O44_105351 [Pedobacter nutrimenti]
MNTILDRTFLNSIVVINNFKLDFGALHLDILCIEGSDTEVNYNIVLSNIAYFVFRQENFDDQFDVIDTFLEKFNESSYVEFMKSDRMQDFWVLRFHSGIHHLIVGFKDLKLYKI